MADSATSETRQVELLDELVALTRFANRDAFLKVIASVMQDPRHLRAFEATDGQRTQGEVGAVAGLKQPTVSGLWARWRRLGLVTERGGRMRHLVRPSDLGLEISEGDTPDHR
jgi:hypothetical protein